MSSYFRELKEIDHPPYSPDLAPCDYFLLKIWGGRWDKVYIVETHFASKDKEYF